MHSVEAFNCRTDYMVVWYFTSNCVFVIYLAFFVEFFGYERRVSMTVMVIKYGRNLE